MLINFFDNKFKLFVRFEIYIYYLVIDDQATWHVYFLRVAQELETYLHLI